jgi:hypothetical protein
MKKKTNDFIAIIFITIFWFIHPIKYSEVKNRHPIIYHKKDLAVVTSSSSNFSKKEIKVLGISNQTTFVENFIESSTPSMYYQRMMNQINGKIRIIINNKKKEDVRK